MSTREPRVRLPTTRSPPARLRILQHRHLSPRPHIPPTSSLRPSNTRPNRNPTLSAPPAGPHAGIAQSAPAPPSRPALNRRAAVRDPDGDIVHPAPLGPGE